MCGIVFWVWRPASQDAEEFSKLTARLRTANTARGPDAQQAYRTSTNGSPGSGALALEFFVSELRLRGDAPITQPHMRDGDVLCWNGEIFDGLDVGSHENDGVKLVEALHGCRTSEQIRDVFAGVEGPYAFVFYKRATKRLYFARDPLGRRSLLIHKPTTTQPYFLLSSVTVSEAPEFEEVSTDGIFCLDLQETLENSDSTTTGLGGNLTVLSRTPSMQVVAPYATLERINPALPPDNWPRLDSLDVIPPHLLQPVEDFEDFLDRSVKLRVQHIPQAPEMNGTARVAVLFSGGIDSTVIAALAHRHVPLGEPIDLLNVAFENPRKIKVQREGNSGGPTNKKPRKPDAPAVVGPVNCTYMVPDRITGLQEVEEFRRLYPDRMWNFVEVNVPYKESQAARSLVESLLLPSKTVMDLSLGLALYFASRGIGQVRNRSTDEPTPYSTPARVLLNGLGSDELLGGYGRHRSAFNTGGWQAVVDELQLEIERIPKRNLGRDDRVISSNGKETRHPFLCLDVACFLAKLPVQNKMDPRLEVGLGDKMILRLVARRLGLVEASARKKRAMQFGSHSARMEGERRGDILLE